MLTVSVHQVSHCDVAADKTGGVSWVTISGKDFDVDLFTDSPAHSAMIVAALKWKEVLSEKEV